MCGINGIVSSKITDIQVAVERMNRRLAHRGPNDEGVWSANSVALGHKRLSIIDLSAAGHQPMTSACGRYILVFNGEIYNYKALKAAISYPYKTGTDSEVILAAWTMHRQNAAAMLHGMFAFAIFDGVEKTVTLVRDRMGIKPLYTCQTEKGFAFSSEIRALIASGIVDATVSPPALVDYLRYQTVQAPDTILENVKMLEPASILTLNTVTGSVETSAYWNMTAFVPQQNIAVEDARREIRKLFFAAVEKRLVADVPFGAFLSGGIDSSAVVGAMVQASTQPVKTFNISFAEEDYSEARYARHIAAMHGTEHHEIQLSPQKFLEYLPEALKSIDHPSGDGANTWVVSKVTKECGIDMALSGLGGDELFAGYAIFKRMLMLQRYKQLWNVPQLLRSLAGRALTQLRHDVASVKTSALLNRTKFDFDAMYAVSRQALMDGVLKGIVSTLPLPAHWPVEKLRRMNVEVDAAHTISRVSIAEMVTYMQNVLLRDSDQMSMAHALEVRVPFLDHELVEFVLSLPNSVKYPHTPKQLLVESMPDLLPDSIVNRPKMGFVFPWAHWLRHELHAYADIRIKKLAKRELFNRQAVLNLWSSFAKGSSEVTYSRILPLVVLEEWMSNNGV